LLKTGGDNLDENESSCDVEIPSDSSSLYGAGGGSHANASSTSSGLSAKGSNQVVSSNASEVLLHIN